LVAVVAVVDALVVVIVVVVSEARVVYSKLDNRDRKLALVLDNSDLGS